MHSSLNTKLEAAGNDMTIKNQAWLAMKVECIASELTHDLTKPGATPRELMSADQLWSLCWSQTTQLRDGASSTNAWRPEIRRYQ